MQISVVDKVSVVFAASEVKLMQKAVLNERTGSTLDIGKRVGGFFS